MANVKLIKLITGDELIADLANDHPDFNGKYTLSDIIRVVYYETDKGMSTGFAPFIPMATDDPITMKESVVMCIAIPKAEVLSEYSRIFSGLIVPPSKLSIVK